MANHKLIDNVIFPPANSTVYDKLCQLTWLQNQEAYGLKKRLIVCVITGME
jgi:hypothetical protein